MRKRIKERGKGMTMRQEGRLKFELLKNHHDYQNKPDALNPVRTWPI